MAYLFRYREISLQSNSRYLNALAQVDDPTPGLRALDVITSRKQPLPARPVKAFNPLARPDHQLFTVLMSGEHALHGFTNRDLRDKLAASVVRLHLDPKKASSQVSRLLHRLHVYGLIAKIPRSRQWRVIPFGNSAMAAAVRLRERDFPRHCAPLLDAGPGSPHAALALWLAHLLVGALGGIAQLTERSRV